jgi:Uma2 family endonuclease
VHSTNEQKIIYEKIIAHNIFTNKEYIIIDRQVNNNILIFHKENNNLYLMKEDISKYDPIWNFQVNIESGKLEKERGIIRHSLEYL